MLKKNATTKWTDDCQKAFDRIKEYLSTSPVLVPPEPDKNFIDPIPVKIHAQLTYCVHVKEEAYGKPWFHDIKEYLAKREYPELANATQKRTLRRLSNNFFHGGGILYRRTPDLGLLRCVDAKEASRLLEEIHLGPVIHI
ncbi:uncharacterized protein [Nicotiana sylvestris]|uniref:uncharacterized protein n=1 Tax=Nicotiana sylvestris TaxID=4096 RepID=UPI00388C72D8